MKTYKADSIVLYLELNYIKNVYELSVYGATK